MNKTEVERHKRWEHPVPASPFEEKVARTKSTETNPEDSQKLTSDVKAEDATVTGGVQRGKVPFKPSRI
jgi:hypothetical protein